MSRNPVTVYGFINAKLRAKIGLMRQDRLSESLLKAASLVEAVGVLRDSRYHDVAQAYDQTGDLQQMELVLLQKEIEMYREVQKYLEGSPSDFVRQLLGKIEVDNLKNCIRLWYSSIIRHRPIRHRSGYLFKDEMLHQVDWTALINATAWDGVLSAVKQTPYWDLLKAFTVQNLEQDGLFTLECRLDRFWYDSVMQSTKALSKQDREVATSILLLEIDVRNLTILVRHGWYHHMEAEELAALLLPYGSVYASPDTQKYLAQSTEQRSPLPIINRYFPSLEQVQVEQTHLNVHPDEASVLENLKIEGFLAARRQSMYQKLLATDPFTIGLSLAYFFLCKEESTMIKAILNGKYYGYEEEYIRGVLG
jgi:V/A-type H+-transporting ATPase subunit C